MFNLLAETGNSQPWLGLSLILLIALAIVTILICIVSLAALVLRIKIFVNYWITDRKKTEGGYNGYSAAVTLLQDLGYGDIQVKQSGFFRAMIFGNHYNPNKKTVYLRKSTYYGENLTAVGLALQKVGLVVLDKNNSASFKMRWRLQKVAVFGPVFFLPIVILGVIGDFVMCVLTGGSFTGLFTLIAACLGFAYFVASFVLSFLVIKVEGRANRETLGIIKGYDFLTPDEQEGVARVFSTYRAAYICDFLINILQLIRIILKILLNIVAAMQNNKNNK